MKFVDVKRIFVEEGFTPNIGKLTFLYSMRGRARFQRFQILIIRLKPYNVRFKFVVTTTPLGSDGGYHFFAWKIVIIKGAGKVISY